MAFAGSFVNPSFITVVDVRNKDDKPVPLPEISTVDDHSYLDFDAKMDTFYRGDRRPRDVDSEAHGPRGHRAAG